MNSIFVAVNGQQLGPFTLDQVRQSVARNEYTRESLAWQEGLAAWVPLGGLLDAVVPPANAPAAAALPASIVSEFTFTKDGLRKIARGQNLLMWSVFAGLCTYFLLHIPVIGLVLWLAAVVFEIYALYSLGRSLRLRAPWAYCILLFIPVVALITLVVISGKASRVLKAYGVRVGFMGGKASDIKD